MGIKLTNNAFGTLAAGINSSATSITLTSGQGARFPTLSAGDYFYATLIDTSNNLEIIKVTARSTDVLTIVRGQETTTARAYSTGDRIEIRLTAATFLDATNAQDGDKGDITVSSSGSVWTIDNSAVTAAKLASTAVTDKLGYTPVSQTNAAILPSSGSGVTRIQIIPQTTPNYPSPGSPGTFVDYYSPAIGESGMIMVTNTNSSGGEYRYFALVYFSRAQDLGNITIVIDEKINSNMLDFQVASQKIQIRNTYGYGLQVVGTVFSTQMS